MTISYRRDLSGRDERVKRYASAANGRGAAWKATRFTVLLREISLSWS